MQQEQTKLTKMSCPACGFQVFNRRYPKCERCGSDLPASLVYSDQERRALLEREEERLSLELKHRELQRTREASRRQQTSNASESTVSTPTPRSGSGVGEQSLLQIALFPVVAECFMAVARLVRSAEIVGLRAPATEVVQSSGLSSALLP